MVIGCCVNCKYIDLIDNDNEGLCPRCSGRMISLGLKSDEWNRLSEDAKQNIITGASVDKSLHPGEIEYVEDTQVEVEKDLEEYGFVQTRAQMQIDPVEPRDNTPISETNDMISTEGVQQDASVISYRNDKSNKPKKVARVQLSDGPSHKNSNDYYGKFSKLSIVAFVLSFLGLGVIPGAIDLAKKDGRKKSLSMGAIVIGAVVLFGTALFIGLNIANNGPEKVVNKFCSGLKAFDNTKMNECLLKPDDKITDPFANEDEQMEAFTSFVIEQAKYIKYEVINSEINGDDATVYVSFTYTDASSVFIDTIREYLKQAFAMAFTGASQEEMESLLLDIFRQKTQETSFGTAECTIPINCSKVNGHWKISDMTTDIMHVMTCNMLKGLEQIQGSFEDKEDSETSEAPDKDKGNYNNTELPSANDLEESSDSAETDDIFELFNKDATIEKKVIYDENDIKITADSLDYGKTSLELNITIENNSDKKYSFTSGTTSYHVNAVNNYMIEDGYLSTDVNPGQSVEDKIKFNYNLIYITGSLEVAQIQVGFQISDEDSNKTFTGPLLIPTSHANNYDYEINDYHNKIENKISQLVYGYDVTNISIDEYPLTDGVEIISDSSLTNDEGKKLLILEVGNDTKDMVFFKTGHITINGELLYDYNLTSDCITSGKKILIGISIDDLFERAEKTVDNASSIGMEIQVFNDKMKPISEKEYLEIDL